LRTAFYLGIIQKMWPMGFLNFVPKVEFGDLKIWGAKIILVPISPPISDSGSRKFLFPWGFRRHTFVLNFKTLTLKTGRGRNLKIRVFDSRGIYISNLVTEKSITYK